MSGRDDDWSVGDKGMTPSYPRSSHISDNKTVTLEVTVLKTGVLESVLGLVGLVSVQGEWAR